MIEVIRVVTVSDTENRITNVVDYPITDDAGNMLHRGWLARVLRWVQWDAHCAEANGERVTINCVDRASDTLAVH